jgi:putative membrane-bound dehydrogenase-like protein
MPALLLLLASCLCAFAAEFRFGEHTLTVPDGFAVERAAGPPAVLRPITMAFDETGALYVADSSGSNEKPEAQAANPTHRVVKLVDSDGDGIFDQHTLFADRLAFPEGTLWHQGALYVAAPPHILKITDADGDGVSDRREVWFDGGTLTDCANDLHGPYAGPDGFLYWCKGAFAEQKHTLGDGRHFVSRAAHVFRARPDGSGLDVVFTAGMDNPVDLAFSSSGERFLSGTFFLHPKGGQRDGIVHAVHGGVWGKDHGVLDHHPRTGPLMPIMTHLGPAAASGLEMLRSGTHGMRGDLLCAEFNMRKVSRHALRPHGATFTTEPADFLVSDQMDFHPTDILEDADGSILIADTGGWYRLCCPTSTAAKPDVLGAIYRVRKTAAPRLEDPRGLSLDWEKVAPAILASRLADPRPAVADRSAAALEALGDEAVSPLSKQNAHSLETRQRIVWVLSRIHGEKARSASRAFLDDPAPEVRIAAAHVAALWRDRSAFSGLAPMLEHGTAAEKRAAAEAFARIGSPAAIPLLLDVSARADSPPDRFLEHAFTYALYEIGAREPLSESSIPIAQTARHMLDEKRAIEPLPPLPWRPSSIPPANDAAAATEKKSRLDALETHLENASASRGGEIFRSQKAACATCHAIGLEGGTLGPDLTRIGSIRSARDLLEAIIWPGSSLVRSYEPVLVTTKSGDVHTGIIRSETRGHLHLAISAGTLSHPIPREQIAAIEPSAQSLMPPGYDGSLSPQDLADLTAFLLLQR